MKQGMRAVAGALVLLLIFTGIVIEANRVTVPWNAKADKVKKTLYSEDTDMEQVEVALIGGSHANNGFNPSVMWEKSRIKAYNFSFSGEPIYMTYYYLKELFKKRSFQLVVLDLYYIGLAKDTFSLDNYMFEVFSSIRWSQDKLDFVRNGVEPKYRSRYYLPLKTYHNRFCELTQADYLRRPMEEDDYLLGSEYHYERNAGEIISFEEETGSQEAGEMPPCSEKYLREIINLVRDNGSELMFVALPHRYNDAAAPDVWVEDEYVVYNRAKQIAEEQGIRMVQFDNKLLGEIGFVPEEDMFNKGHMNIYGSEKVSGYLSEYIKSCYPVTVYSDDGTDLWDDYLVKYRKEYERKYEKAPDTKDVHK